MYSPISTNKSNARKRMQQTSLMGANATTATPQVTPTTAQPIQKFAQGGMPVPNPPTPGQAAQANQQQFDPHLISALTKAILTTPAVQGLVKQASAQKQGAPQTAEQGNMEALMQEYNSPIGQQMLQDRAKMQSQPPQNSAAVAPTQTPPQTQQAVQQQPQMAKGGSVSEEIKKMPLKEVMKLLQAHPELSGMGEANPSSPSTGPNMRAGGAIGGQSDPDAIAKRPTHMKSEATSHGKGLLDMNADVQTYKTGGAVDDTDSEVQGNSNGLLHMADGGLEGGDTEEDSIVSYGPDGTPIVQNPDGTEGYGDIDQFLDRPSSSPTLGTGQTPNSISSKSAGNSVAGANGTAYMAEGGEANNPPPGSLKDEVADNVDAKLSPGEFVFSADATRYYGLQFLNGLMQHARQQLTSMNNDGNIRSPGDGKNPQDTDEDNDGDGQFMQDAVPNKAAYAPDGSNKPKGLLNSPEMKAAGGSVEASFNARQLNTPSPNMATGGGLSEDQSLAKGGPVYNKNLAPYGRDNMVSAHQKGGSPLMDYNKGGIVSSTAPSLAIKKGETGIPALKQPKLSTSGTPKGPNPASYGVKEKLPKLKKGGLINQKRDINKTMSYIGS